VRTTEAQLACLLYERRGRWKKGSSFTSLLYFPLLVLFIVEKEVTIVGEGLAACCCGGGDFIAHCFDLFNYSCLLYLSRKRERPCLVLASLVELGGCLLANSDWGLVV